MRTDVKIGIAVSLFVAIVAVVYFIAVDLGKDSDKQRTQTQALQPSGDGILISKPGQPAESVTDTSVDESATAGGSDAAHHLAGLG